MNDERGSCPSRLALDRLRHGGCSEAGAQRLRAHLQTCSQCSEWMARTGTEEERLQRSVDAEQFVSEVLRRGKHTRARASAAEERSGLLDWLRAHLLPISAVAATACLALVGWHLLIGRVQPPSRGNVPAEADTDRETLVKGAASVRIYCQRSGRVFQLETGQRVRAGDALRLEVFSERAPYLLGLALQADGQSSVYVPFGGERSRPIKPGQKQLLEGSLTLDDSPQDELLVLLFSERPIEAALARERARQAYERAGGKLGAIRRLKLPAEQVLRLLPRHAER